MPPDVGDPAGEATYRDMDSCIRLPLLHCAFKGCKCNISRGIYCSKLYHWQLEIEIYEHVKKAHTAEMEEVTEWIKRRSGSGDLIVMKWTYSFYIAAVMQREREHMPLAGPTKDRQMLGYATMLANSKTICSRMQSVTMINRTNSATH